MSTKVEESDFLFCSDNVLIRNGKLFPKQVKGGKRRGREYTSGAVT